jgi:hypothetical protein
MEILIKTQKPDEIEKELKETVEKYKSGIKIKGRSKFLMRIAGIDPKMITDSISMDYVKINANSFKFNVIYPMIDHTKGIFLKKLNSEMKKTDKNIEIAEIKE